MLITYKYSELGVDPGLNNMELRDLVLILQHKYMNITNNNR